MKTIFPMLICAALVVFAHAEAPKEGEKVEKELKVAVPPKDATRVQIQQNGTLTMNGANLSPDEFRVKIAELARKNPDSAVILHADSKTPYKHVAHVFDLCAAVGIRNLSMAAPKLE